MSSHTLTYDLLECACCRQRVMLTSKSCGEIQCCGFPMRNVTYDRLGHYLDLSLAQKSSLNQCLSSIQSKLEQSDRFNEELISLKGLIQRQQASAGKFAQLLMSVSDEPTSLSNSLMNVINDLYLSSLNLYPNFSWEAKSEGSTEYARLFDEATELDKEAITLLEDILYLIGKGSKPTE
ncbi:hypothetical protein ACK14O_14705 [Vibrio harveyi]|uniref:hypothetical protein n=1 Tax=Vibrio harveyi TaxID=669 RepID=UPI001C962E8D|nr:hypothetical protein [Vibrio harveyi]MBY6236821.1 hypothetical protein [Vibrio harveyi]HEQ3586433.1 hypothetical protein [Vibrio harveyi]HEQ3595821.1 hypothetical protein [Vibrio harveyi]HEQ3606403.1 hypothetical protein [Vibrio harveyi]